MRRTILTKEVLSTIPQLVDSGLRSQDIAMRLGCKVTTLKVRCSQARISLCHPSRRHAPRERGYGTIRLNKDALRLLQDRAAATGKSEAIVARELIETIARDNLYDAVLDT
jgi:hypothetical protein